MKNSQLGKKSISESLKQRTSKQWEDIIKAMVPEKYWIKVACTVWWDFVDVYRGSFGEATQFFTDCRLDFDIKVDGEFKGKEIEPLLISIGYSRRDAQLRRKSIDDLRKITIERRSGDDPKYMKYLKGMNNASTSSEKADIMDEIIKKERARRHGQDCTARINTIT